MTISLDAILGYILGAAICFAIPITAVVLVLVAGYIIRLLPLYYLRIRGTKSPEECPNITIPPEVTELISRFDPNIRIKISNDQRVFAQAASFNKRPAYIIFSRQILERGTPESAWIDTDDIVAITAHELGHIIPKSYAMWSLGVIMSGMFCVVVLSLATRSVYPIVLVPVLLFWSGAISQKEELLADRFAIIEAKIPTAKFTGSLVKLYDYVSKQHLERVTAWGFLFDSLLALLFNSHPDIEKRVTRLRALYPDH